MPSFWSVQKESNMRRRMRRRSPLKVMTPTLEETDQGALYLSLYFPKQIQILSVSNRTVSS
jgi:hypothetical protein